MFIKHVESESSEQTTSYIDIADAGRNELIFWLYNASIYPSMKGDSLSINRIYGDPQLLALNNRVKYIKNKQNKARLPFTTISTT